MMQGSRKKRIIWFVGIGGVGCAGLLLLSVHRKSQSSHHTHQTARYDLRSDLFNHSSVILASRKKYGEIDIPFTLHDGHIILKMTWAGKPVEAILDTGSYWVVWPQTLHLSSTKTDISQVGFMAANVTTDGEWRILPSIKAGGCEWRDMPSIAAGPMKVQATPQNKLTQLKAIAPPKPLLGVPAFQNMVLTIDYQKRQIILRRPAYDITHLPHRPHDLLLSPDWDNGFMPILKGKFANRPARFAVDTGCAGIAMTTKFVRLLPASYSYGTTITNINGQLVKVQRLKPISGMIMDSKFLSIDTPVMDISIQSDALVGIGFLKQFRVTFDYGRGKILLEPYSGGQR